jgi:hypothetical protein
MSLEPDILSTMSDIATVLETRLRNYSRVIWKKSDLCLRLRRQPH